MVTAHVQTIAKQVFPPPVIYVPEGTATCGIAIYVLESTPAAKLKLTFYLRQNKLLTSLMLPNSKELSL